MYFVIHKFDCLEHCPSARFGHPFASSLSVEPMTSSNSRQPDIAPPRTRGTQIERGSCNTKPNHNNRSVGARGLRCRPVAWLFRFAVQASAERIKACADVLNQWYQYEGYLLSSVSDAVISPNGNASLRHIVCHFYRFRLGKFSRRAAIFVLRCVLFWVTPNCTPALKICFSGAPLIVDWA